MKKNFRILGLIVIMAVIGFSMASCDDKPKTPNTPPVVFTPVEDDVINGLWWCEGLMRGSDGQGTPGVWVFDYPNFWRLNSWGYAKKGTYTISGEGFGGDATGSFITSINRNKDDTTSYGWANIDPATVESGSRTWELTENGTKLKIGVFEFIKTSWDAEENNYATNGLWQNKIGESALTALIPARQVSLVVNETFAAISGTYDAPGSPVVLLVTTEHNPTTKVDFPTGVKTQEIPLSGGTYTIQKASLALPESDKIYLKAVAVVDGRRLASEVFECKPAYDCELEITSFFGANIVGTYAAPDGASEVKLVYSTASAFTSPVEIDLSGGTINVVKSTLPASSLLYLKVVATVGEETKESNVAKIHTGEFLQVNSFTTEDPYAADVGTTGSTVTVSVAGGIWSINYNATQAYNAYGRIYLSNVLDANSKSISAIKGVYYKQKSTGNINQTVTYVREDSSAKTFNENNIKGVGELDIWTEVLESPDYSTLSNSAANRRLSIGMTGVGNVAGTLFVKDLYLIF